MKLHQVVAVSQAVAETSGRLRKIELLAGLLRELAPHEVPIVVPYLSGALRQGKIRIGYRTLSGLTGSSTEATLDIADADHAFQQIAAASGKGAEQQRGAILAALLARATAEEAGFLKRLLVGELRQGALEGILVDAVAKASGTVSADRVRRAAMLAGDLAPVAAALLDAVSSANPAAALDRFRIQLFRPVQPMLAQAAEDIEDALAQTGGGELALEYKMDGARVQVHKIGQDVAIYSRNLNEVTAAIPEIVELVRTMPARELILDGEVISLADGGRPNPFQVTMRRFGRRLNVEEMRRELPLTPFWFDLIQLDGAELLDEPQQRRFDALRRLTAAVPDQLIPHLRTADPASGFAFLESALARGHEGVMAKLPGSAYAAGARGSSWLKVKRARTLDLVVLAAEWGSGRRRGWLSNLHLGALDAATGAFVMLGKTFKGLTDETLAWQTVELLKIEAARDSYTVYVEPKLVVEIAFNDLQTSSRYPGGLALRFARVKRYRPDKTPAQADTMDTVRLHASASSGGDSEE